VQNLRPKVAAEGDDALFLLEAAARGGYVAFVPGGLARDAVATGRLRIIARLTSPHGSVHALYHVRQVTFVEAHKSLARFDVTRSFAAWLHGIAIRQASNHLRKARRWRWLSFGSTEEKQVADDRVAIEQQTIQREILGRLYRAMDRLPPKKRVAFSLHAIDGLGFVEIGALIGESPQTVRARVLSAREAVLAHLGKESPIDLAALEQIT